MPGGPCSSPCVLPTCSSWALITFGMSKYSRTLGDFKTYQHTNHTITYPPHHHHPCHHPSSLHHPQHPSSAPCTPNPTHSTTTTHITPSHHTQPTTNPTTPTPPPPQRKSGALMLIFHGLLHIVYPFDRQLA